MVRYRKERVAELLLAFLGEQLSRLNDPRLSLITLTDVEMSADLKSARVFWTIHTHLRKGQDQVPVTAAEDIAMGERALVGARALFRSRIAEQLELRYLPELYFRFDDSIDRGMRIDYLLRKASER